MRSLFFPFKRVERFKNILSLKLRIRKLNNLAVPETKGLSIAESSEDTIDLVKKFKYREWKTWNKEK